MMDPKELVRPSVLLALAGGAAIGFAAGFLVGRDPQLLRRVLAAAAQGWEQARLSAAEAREAVADQWAEARDEAVDKVEQAAFAGPAAAAPASPVGPEHGGEHEPEAAPRPKRRAKAASGRRAPRAARTTH